MQLRITKMMVIAFIAFFITIKEAITDPEANVYRLAEVSGNIIDQCVARYLLQENMAEL